MPPTACSLTTTAPPAGLLAAQTMPVRPQTVLLVEDSRFAAEAVRLICRRAGLRLRRADCLASARQHLRVYRPDIALIDLGLPDGSGLDLIDELNRQKPRIDRIVALTGEPVLEQAARRAGADAFLEKPISVTHHLARLLGEARDLGEPPEVIDTALGLSPGTTGAWLPPIQPSLFGQFRTRPWERNTGADPLALRDDLLRAQDMLAHDTEPAQIGYAAQFLAGIARSMDDQPLLALAERVRRSGETAALIAHLRLRVSTGPPL